MIKNLNRNNNDLLYRQFRIAKVEDRYIVIKSFTPDIEIGDEIIKIDNTTISEEINTYTLPGSAQYKESIREWILKIADGKVETVIFKRSNKLDTIVVNSAKDDPFKLGFKKIEELDKDIVYIHIPTTKVKELKKELNQRKSKKFIFDFRKSHDYGYPTNAARFLLNCLAESPSKSMKIRYPINTAPAQLKRYWGKYGHEWKIKTNSIEIDKEDYIILIDESIISYLESCLEVIEYYNLGTMVGRKTAGTTGDIKTLSIYNYEITFTQPLATRDGIVFDGVEPEIEIQLADIPKSHNYDLVNYVAEQFLEIVSHE